MLSGLRFEKQGEAKQDKKSKKKERRKEKKKKKKQKAKHKDTVASSSSSDSSARPDCVAKAASAETITLAGDTKGPAQHAAMEDDFFSKLGTERERKQNKPNPDELVLHANELNPMLKGKDLTQPAPTTIGAIPKNLMMKNSDGGANWRQRAQKRAAQAAVATRDPAEPILRRLGTERGDDNGKAASRRSQRSQSRSRSRSRSKGLRGRGSNAVGDWRKTETKVSQEQDTEKGTTKDIDDVLRKFQSKFGGPSEAPSVAEAQSVTKEEVVIEEEPEDANELAALAMQAMLSGDMARYEELNRRLEKRQSNVAQASKEQNVSSNPTSARGPNRERVEVIEEIDAAGRNRVLLDSVQSSSVGTGQRGAKKLKGVANVGLGGTGKKDKGFYADDDVSLDDLIRREKIEGVQDYDSNFASHIIKHKSYKPIHEDDDEAYALGMYENASKKADAKKLAVKQRKQEIHEKSRIKHNLDNCWKCMESKKFRLGDAIISSSTHAYVCADDFRNSVLPGQVFICPQDHLPALTDLDDTAYAEIRNYQKCLVRFFEAQEPPKAVIFAESAVHQVSKEKLLLGAGPHAILVAYPIDLPVFSQAKSFFRKAFDEAECEWSAQHKKVIETTAKGGVRAAIPKHFPYVHIDFALQGGYAHVVEDTAEFPRQFAQQTIAGMCELTILDRAYATKDAYWEATRSMKQKFRQEFDWTQSLH